MEYCNLGPLHHYMAERRFVRQMSMGPATGGANSPMPDGGSPGTGSAQFGVSGALGAGDRPATSDSFSDISGSNANGAQPQADMAMLVATLMEVAEAMMYLHSSGFIHCDLKPENILLKVAPVSHKWKG